MVVKWFLNEALEAELDHDVRTQAHNTDKTMGVIDVAILPDTHKGYGAPIGSVVVTKDRILPGPVGYDIGCGMISAQTNITDKNFKPKRQEVMRKIIESVAMGPGLSNPWLKLSDSEFQNVLNNGAVAVQEMGYIETEDLERLERKFIETDFDFKRDCPDKARRGQSQLGTLGGGNHFIEFGRVKVVDSELADHFGVQEGNTSLIVHSGSRGFGHGLADYYFKEFKKYNDSHGEHYLDRELVHAPTDSALGQEYIRAHNAGANFAMANRLLMFTKIREVLKEFFPDSETKLIYEISHNLAQKEKIDDEEFFIHRKGAIRAFPAGHYFLKGTLWENTGHPVITPGSMGTYSVLQVGQEGAKESYYSINHGAGRRLGRREAKRTLNQETVDKWMRDRDIITNANPLDEAPQAYKNLDDVLAANKKHNIASVVARLEPVLCMKDEK